MLESVAVHPSSVPLTKSPAAAPQARSSRSRKPTSSLHDDGSLSTSTNTLPPDSGNSVARNSIHLTSMVARGRQRDREAQSIRGNTALHHNFPPTPSTTSESAASVQVNRRRARSNPPPRQLQASVTVSDQTSVDNHHGTHCLIPRVIYESTHALYYRNDRSFAIKCVPWGSQIAPVRSAIFKCICCRSCDYKANS